MKLAKAPEAPSLHGLDVRTLRLFSAVASTENLTQAAQANHLAVGAASRRISNFEAMVGELLLERNSRGLRLTPAGKMIAEHVEKILDQLDKLSLTSLTLHTGVQNHVRILCNSATLTQHLPSTVSRFYNAHPDTLVDIEEVRSFNIPQAVLQHRANIGIMTRNSSILGLDHFPYRNERMLLVAYTGHPLAHYDRVHLEDTFDYEYIGLSVGSSVFKHLEDLARIAGKAMRIHARVGGLENACRMVSAGLGLTVAPEALARSLKTALNLKLIELDGEQHVFNEIVVHNPKSTMTDTERAFLEHLRNDHEPKQASSRSKNKRS